MTRFPVFELAQPGADGANRHPAVKAVGGVGREQEAAVSGQCPAQQTPERRVAVRGLLAGHA